MVRRGSIFRILTFIVIALFIMCLFIPLLPIKGDYKIKEGDSYNFHVDKFRDEEGDPKVQIYPTLGLTLRENATIEINVTMFELPYIKYRVSVDDGPSQELALFNELIFVDRNWDELRAEYELTQYEVFENKTVWGVRDNRNGFVELQYLKKDGVLCQFYANEYSPLITELNVYEVKISRTDIKTAGLPLLTFIPIALSGIVLLLLVKRKKA
ncbi:MAG: hypothetical protein ACFFDW_13600 [Candidatus Thorarchaeota archaeon]